jgi:GTPase SAR1 family protein
MREPLIGIWGPTRAGKTTLLARIYQEMLASKWNMEPFNNDPRTIDYINLVLKPLSNGFVPQSTPVGDLYDFLFAYNGPGKRFRHRNKKYRLGLADAAGVFLEDNSSTIPRAWKEDYFEYLSICDGLLLIIDPEYIVRQQALGLSSYFEMVESLFTALVSSHNGMVKPVISLCVSKMDLEPHHSHVTKIEDYLKQIIGAKTYKIFTQYCFADRFKVFPTSAVGRYRTPGGLERPNLIQTPSGDRIPNLETSGYNASRALLWLFYKIDFDTLTFVERFGRYPLYYD